MDLLAQDTAVITNEKIVEIAFGIVLDRIRRTAPKENLKLSSTKGFNVSRNLSSRCVRTYSYQCNDAGTTSGEDSSEHRDACRSIPKPEQHPKRLRPVEKDSHNASKRKDASTKMTPPQQPLHCEGDSGRYYMLTDTRSRETVLACHDSAGMLEAEAVETRGTDCGQLSGVKLAADRRCRRGLWNKSRSASGSGSTSPAVAPTAAVESRTFCVKIDQQQLGRALGSLSTTVFPEELLVDVKCPDSCRVSEVSLRQGRGKQCLLSVRVDSTAEGCCGRADAERSPATALAVRADCSAAGGSDAAEDNVTARNLVDVTVDQLTYFGEH